MTASSSTPRPPPIPSRSSSVPDPRRNAFRSDLAAQSLYGRINAPRYAAGETRQVTRAAVALRARPHSAAGFETEALFGEVVTVYEEKDGWAWLQLERDRYVGYAPAETLSAEVRKPTHRVTALGTFVYPQPDMKSPPMMHLSINASLAVADTDGKFCRLRSGGFVFARHVAEAGWQARDFVEVAERFIGTPYLWGGRTRIAIDCSGLVQVALDAAGIPCPRDSDMQEQEIGEYMTHSPSLENLQRGDLVFWKGHVGIMSDAIMMVHANAHHMAVAAETLPEARDRIRHAGGGDITAIKRLPGLCAERPR